MTLVRTEAIGDVLMIEIDNPPINAASLGVRRGLGDAIARLGADPSLRAAVVIGAGSTFVAGSDLREFGQPPQEPQLPGVLGAIEACAKPVVAALHGAALGGAAPAAPHRAGSHLRDGRQRRADQGGGGARSAPGRRGGR